MHMHTTMSQNWEWVSSGRMWIPETPQVYKRISLFLISAPSPPCAPVINPQDANSATGTSVRVCWSFFSEDLVESYQLYYKRISNDASKEEQTGKMVETRGDFVGKETTISNFILGVPSSGRIWTFHAPPSEGRNRL